jgi:hypothetical protein
LTLKFKEASLITFLCNSMETHKTFGLGLLSEVFDLEEKVIVKTISKLIMKKEIVGLRINMKEKLIVMEYDLNNFKESHHLTLQFVQKVDQMVDSNERTLDLLRNTSKFNPKDR